MKPWMWTMLFGGWMGGALAGNYTDWWWWVNVLVLNFLAFMAYKQN